MRFASKKCGCGKFERFFEPNPFAETPNHKRGGKPRAGSLYSKGISA
jgi:hypothetical protein